MSSTSQTTQQASGTETVTNALASSSIALQQYNPSVSTSINKTGAYAQTFNISKSVREIDINSFMYYFFISIFLILTIVFFAKGK